MSKQTALQPEDRSWVDGMIDGYVNGGEVVVTRIAASVGSDVRTRAESGDGQAERSLLALAVDGLCGRVAARLKTDEGTIRIARTGRVLSVPARFGVRARKADGRKADYYQQPLWWEMPWAQFEELVASLEAMRDRLGLEISGFRDVLVLHQRFPDTATPEEACERAGIDPRCFDLGAA